MNNRFFLIAILIYLSVQVLGQDVVPRQAPIVKYIRKPRVNLLRSKQSVEDKVNNILYQYHDNIQSFKETLYQDFINFKDKPYGYEQQIASR